MTEVKLEDALKELEEAGIDTSKVTQSIQPAHTIHKYSMCDVYRNNKAFLWKILIQSEYEDLYEKIREDFWAKTLEEADKKFEEANGYLPTWRYSKLQKIYNQFREKVFII